MLRHQKLHVISVLRIDSEVGGKSFDFLGAKLGVASSATFGNIVKKSGKCQTPGLFNVVHDLRAQGVFVRVGRVRQAAEIFDNAERVLIDRVNVKKIVLHLSDDASPDGQEASENAPCVEVL